MQDTFIYSALDWPAREERMIPTMRPYKAKASAKMRMRIIPTKSFGCCAFALQKYNHIPTKHTLTMEISQVNKCKTSSIISMNGKCRKQFTCIPVSRPHICIYCEKQTNIYLQQLFVKYPITLKEHNVGFLSQHS
jgi:hypothetical protein